MSDEKPDKQEKVVVVVNLNGETLPGEVKNGQVRVEINHAVSIHPEAGLVSDGPYHARGEAHPGKGLGEYHKAKGA